MLQLLTPAGLWALAALALPLAIHLWRPPPRTVRLGSLRFLENLPHRRIRNLRWREYALLAARLSLLVALALLLAGPRWQRQPPTGPQRWALLDPTAALSGESLARLDRLRASGVAMHRLAPGLPIVESPGASGDSAPPDLWSLLREADAALPGGSVLTVFTPGRLSALRGTRPALRHCRVEWVQTPGVGGPGARSWIESLRAGTADVRAIVGTSDGSATSFRSDELPPALGSAPSPPLELSPDHARARLTLPSPGPWTPVAHAAGPVRLLILHDPDRAEDARYVAAAARAVAAVGEPVIVTVRPANDVETSGADWIFWLGNQPLPERVASRSRNVVRDARVASRELPGSSKGRIVAPPGTPGMAALDVASVNLWRRTPAPPTAPAAETLWTDGQGEPLLTRESSTRSTLWNFYSRFHPDWNDLPRSGALAAWMRALLFPGSSDATADPARDRRLADPTQYLPAPRPAADTLRDPASSRVPDATDLRWPVWLLAVSFFAVERFLAHRPSHGLPAVPLTPASAAAR